MPRSGKIYALSFFTSEKFVDRALEAGAIWFPYAVESGTDEIQRLVKKCLDLEKSMRLVFSRARSSWTARWKLAPSGSPTPSNRAQTKFNAWLRNASIWKKLSA